MKQLEREADLFCSSFYSSSMALQPNLNLGHFNLPPPGISISAPSIFRLRASLSPPLQSSASRHLYLHLFNLPPSDVFISTSSIFRLQASLSSSVLHLLHFSVLLTLLSTTSNHILLVFPIVLLHSMYPFSAQLPQ